MILKFPILTLLISGAISGNYGQDCKCGVPNLDTRIAKASKLINAKVAPKGRYPWMVWVFTLVKPETGEGYSCGGSIINDRWILTAAHCLAEHKSTPRNLQIYDKVVNIQSLEKDPLQVSEIFVHPDYETAESRFPKFDLGLVKLAKPLEFDDAKNMVAPICILKENAANRQRDESDEIIYDNLMLSGWGKVLTRDGRGLKDTKLLHEGTLTQISAQECYRSHGFEIDPKNQLCAGDPDDNFLDSATEQGDSGSPLATIQDGIYYQVGLTSFGAEGVKESIENAISVFERVNSQDHLDWILDTIGSDAKWCPNDNAVIP